MIPAGTLLSRADGVEYTTDAEAVIVGSVAEVAVTAVAGGQAGNAAGGIRLTFSSPVAGVNATATVTAGGLTGGADIESDTSLRARLRRRVQHPPHGGAQYDYEAWALEVPGVTRVWVFPAWLGLGTVGVFSCAMTTRTSSPTPPRLRPCKPTLMRAGP